MCRVVLWLMLLLTQRGLYAYEFLNDSSSSVAENEYLESQKLRKPFSKSHWLKAKEGLQYVDEEEEAKPNKPLPSFSGINIPKQLKYILVAFVIIGFLVIVWLIRKDIIQWPKRKNAAFTTLQNTSSKDENLELGNLKLLADHALADQNYPLAMRYVYLSAIQQLVLHKILVWKKGLPNRAILKTIKIQEQYRLAAFLFVEFEKAHYGALPVSYDQFQNYSEIYTAFVHTFSPILRHVEKK